MAKITIYHNDKIVGVEDFKRNFFVLEDENEIFWSIDDRAERPGVIKVWVQQADVSPRIAFILPEWSIAIDDTPLEQSFYEGIIGLAGKTVSAEYNSYRFVFQF